MSDLVKAPPRALVPAASASEARARIAAARARLARDLDAVERRVAPYRSWRTAVSQHPVLAVGGAFLVGLVLSRVLSRK